MAGASRYFGSKALQAASEPLEKPDWLSGASDWINRISSPLQSAGGTSGMGGATGLGAMVGGPVGAGIGAGLDVAGKGVDFLMGEAEKRNAQNQKNNEDSELRQRQAAKDAYTKWLNGQSMGYQGAQMLNTNADNAMKRNGHVWGKVLS